MGAWGYDYFEDDSALDFMEDIEESTHPKNTIRKAFDDAMDSDYLESDAGSAIIVAAAYVDGQVNGTKFSGSEENEPLPVDTFSARYPDSQLQDLKETAVNALRRVLADDSELKELWEESGEFEDWRAGIELLIGRLAS